MSQFINGRIAEGSTGESMKIVDPSNGTTVQSTTLAGSDDVKVAIAAARQAFPEWSRSTPAERSRVLTRFAALMEERAEEFSILDRKSVV